MIMTQVHLSNILNIQAFSTTAKILICTTTLQMPNNEIVVLSDKLTLQSDGSDSSISFALPTALLLSVVVSGLTGPILQGECFVIASIYHSRIGVALYRSVLFADYYVSARPLAYPGADSFNPLEQKGRMRLYTPANPAAGANVIIPVPSGMTWVPLAFGFLFTAGVGGAARELNHRFTNGTTVFYLSVASPTVAATMAANIYFAKDASDSRSLSLSSSMPAIRMPEAFTIESVITNIIAGDQISNVTLLVEEWATV